MLQNTTNPPPTAEAENIDDVTSTNTQNPSSSSAKTPRSGHSHAVTSEFLQHIKHIRRHDLTKLIQELSNEKELRDGALWEGTPLVDVETTRRPIEGDVFDMGGVVVRRQSSSKTRNEQEKLQQQQQQIEDELSSSSDDDDKERQQEKDEEENYDDGVEESCCSLNDFGYLTIRCCPEDQEEGNIAAKADSIAKRTYTFLLEINFFSLVLHVCFLVFLWLVLWLLFPKQSSQSILFNPGGLVFDTVVLYIVAMLGGDFGSKVFGIPPLIVIFFIGLAWGNIPHYNFLTSGISSETRRVISRLALTNILLRTGLAVSGKVIARAKWNIIAMSFLPVIAELLVHGFVAGALFDDYKNPLPDTSAIWPFLQGAVVAPSASGVVAAVVMIIQAKGYTITRGLGVLLIPACALDMTFGIWAINFIASLIFRAPEDSLAWLIILGPLQLALGGLIGAILGLFWYYVCVNVVCKEYLHHIRNAEEAAKKKQMMLKKMKKDKNPTKKSVGAKQPKKEITTVADPKQGQPKQFFFTAEQFDYIVWFSTATLFILACFCIFCGYFIKTAGGGCIACTMLGATVTALLTQEEAKPSEDETKKEDGVATNSSCWGWWSSCNPILSSIAHPAEQHRLRARLVHNFALLWDRLLIVLFAMSSSSLDVVSMFDPATVGVAIATIFIAFICRAIVNGACSYSFPHMTTSEWLICAICLGGKGFTQVALADIGKTIVKDQIQKMGTNLTASAQANVQQWNRVANNVANTGALSIIFCSPLVVALLSIVGPKCFWMTDAEWIAKEAQDKKEKEKEAAEEEMKSKEKTVDEDTKIVNNEPASK